MLMTSFYNDVISIFTPFVYFLLLVESPSWHLNGKIISYEAVLLHSVLANKRRNVRYGHPNLIAAPSVLEIHIHFSAICTISVDHTNTLS